MSVTTDTSAEPSEMCLLCRDRGPAGFRCLCGRSDAHTPLPTSDHDANGEPRGAAGDPTDELERAWLDGELTYWEAWAYAEEAGYGFGYGDDDV